MLCHRKVSVSHGWTIYSGGRHFEESTILYIDWFCILLIPNNVFEVFFQYNLFRLLGLLTGLTALTIIAHDKLYEIIFIKQTELLKHFHTKFNQG